MEEVTTKEELQNRCIEQTAKIEQLNQLVRYYFSFWNLISYELFSIVDLILVAGICRLSNINVREVGL